MKNLTLISLAFAATLVLYPQKSAACPCLALVDSQVDEVAQRAMVVVGETQLDYFFQIAVEGDAQELGWLIPTPAVPNDPTLAESSLFDRLDENTQVFLHSCSGGGGGACGAVENKLAGDDSGQVKVWSQGQLDNLDYTVLSATDGSDLATWLQNNNYPVSTSVQAMIDRYVAEGWSFVALKVSGQALTGDRPVLGPIRISVPYSGAPVFPMGMTSLSSAENLSLILYVAAAEHMVPDNYDIITKVAHDKLSQNENYESNYNQVVKEAIAEADRSAFVLEHADTLYYNDGTGSALNQLLDGKNVIRLHAEAAPAKYSQDLQLVVRTGLETPFYDCIPGADEDGGTGCSAVGQMFGTLGPGLVVMFGLLASRALRRIRRSA